MFQVEKWWIRRSNFEKGENLKRKSFQQYFVAWKKIFFTVGYCYSSYYTQTLTHTISKLGIKEKRRKWDLKDNMLPAAKWCNLFTLGKNDCIQNKISLKILK